jgi:hypothetical protein
MIINNFIKNYALSSYNIRGRYWAVNLYKNELSEIKFAAE